MKQNKIIKRTVKPKNNYFKYAALVLLIVFAAVGVSQVLGFDIINKDTKACYDKNGNLFVPLDKDGIIDDCGKHDGAVTFDFDGGSGGGGGNMVGDGTGYVRFVDGRRLLTEDGKVWALDLNLIWVEQTNIAPIDKEIVNSIVNWTQNSFITNTNYYAFEYSQEPGISEYKQVNFPNK